VVGVALIACFLKASFGLTFYGGFLELIVFATFAQFLL
jgi:hypothetical protein